ncbi:MAG: hypothetical protein Athens101410_591 [Parcubacteria group bacterium Athens1014_10]|nr:MAG: hypothetical protein Athens101410_591 [Parcubacteria group bacterium Athens1014_10]TSD04652.1 MAG: hypothetical protein Athens071412_719 [Parcubacteria group bacterium Athens0714_12]
MNNKKITIYFGLTTFILGAIFLLNAKAVQAQVQNPDDLIIIFTPNPLFDEANFLPGNTVSGFAEVKNKSNAQQRIITEAINIDDLDNLAEVFDLKIKDTGTTYFDGTLAKFFDTIEVPLSILGINASTTYEFLITFQPGTEDKKYQGKTLKNFDIMIGFSGTEGGGPLTYACNDGVDNDGDTLIDMADPGCASPTDGDETDAAPPGGTGGGGSGGGPPRGLIILNETATTTITNATITWMTSHAATSQVIYSETQGTFDLSQGPPKYGYDNTKEGDDVFGNGKGTGHQVTLKGLTPETTYYFRCVSHGSPLATSYEGTFTTKEPLHGYTPPGLPGAPGETPSGAPQGLWLPDYAGPSGLLPIPEPGTPGIPAGELAYAPSGRAPIPASGVIPEIGEEVSEGEITPEEGEEESEIGLTGNEFKTGFMAGAILPALRFMSRPVFWALLLFALLVLYFLLYKKKKKKDDSDYKN